MIREVREINCPESTYEVSQKQVTTEADDFDVEESFAQTLGKKINS
jgi:hypothetical protein